MKKLRSILVLFLLVSGMLMIGSNVGATQGKLTKSSIEKCGKTLWGYHNPTRRHWHKAVYHKKSGYYALDWSHEYKRVGKCKYKLSSAKKKKKKKSVVTAHSNTPKKSSGGSYGNHNTNTENSYSSSNATVQKHVANSDVAKADTSDVDNDIDTLKDQEETTPEVSTYGDNDVSTQNSDDESYDSGTVMTALVMGVIGGAGGIHLVRKNRSKKKKDDLTNW